MDQCSDVINSTIQVRLIIEKTSSLSLVQSQHILSEKKLDDRHCTLSVGN